MLVSSVQSYDAMPLAVSTTPAHARTDTPSLFTRAAQGLTRVLALQGVANAGLDAPMRHGGGYTTEAYALYAAEVSVPLARCVSRYGASPLPAERIVAHCLARQAQQVCAGGTDDACTTVALRSLDAGCREPQDLVSPDRSVSQVRKDLLDRFVDSAQFEASMDRLEATIRRRTGEVPGDRAHRYTQARLLALVDEKGDDFNEQVRIEGQRLNRDMHQIACERYQLEPESLDRARLERIVRAVDRHYPSAENGTMTHAQHGNVLADLAWYMNGERRV